MADNHLVFSWRPWSDVGTNATVLWENDFLIDVVAPDIKIENFEPTYKEDGVTVDKTAEANYTAAINAIVKEKIHAEVTMEDGTVHHSTSAAPHGVRADRGKQIVLTIPNVNLKDNTYSVKVYIELPNGSQVVGVREYTKLDEVKNAAISNDDSFVLTFDEVPNASTYTYQIIGDTYEGNVEVANPEGTEIPTITLESGTYNIVITAMSDYYVDSVTTFEGILTVVNESVIRDARNYFEIEAWHQNTEQDYVIRFKPISNAITLPTEGMVSDVSVLDRDGNEKKDANTGGIKSHKINDDINATQSTSYYDADTGYYIFGLDTKAFKLLESYQVYFAVTTNSGDIYIFHFLLRTVTKDVAKSEITHIRDMLLVNGDNFGLTEDCYSEENWKTITDLYDPIRTAINDDTYLSKDLLDLYTTNAALARSKDLLDNCTGIELAVKATWKVTTTDGTSQKVVNGNYGDCDQLSKDDGITRRHYLIELDQEYTVAAMYLRWGNANAQAYSIYVSTDGNTWDENPVAQYSYLSVRKDKAEIFSLQSSENVKYIKIICDKVNHGDYGCKLYEIDLYVHN